MPAPATAVSWKSTPSTTPTTTWKVWVSKFVASPRHADLCWSPARWPDIGGSPETPTWEAVPLPSCGGGGGIAAAMAGCSGELRLPGQRVQGDPRWTGSLPAARPSPSISCGRSWRWCARAIRQGGIGHQPIIPRCRHPSGEATGCGRAQGRGSVRADVVVTQVVQKPERWSNEPGWELRPQTNSRQPRWSACHCRLSRPSGRWCRVG